MKLLHVRIWFCTFILPTCTDGFWGFCRVSGFVGLSRLRVHARGVLQSFVALDGFRDGIASGYRFASISGLI